MALNWKI